MSCVLNVLERVFGSRPSGRLASQYAGPGKRKARHHSSSIHGGLHCLRKATREETKLIPRGPDLFARGRPNIGAFVGACQQRIISAASSIPKGSYTARSEASERKADALAASIVTPRDRRGTTTFTLRRCGSAA